MDTARLIAAGVGPTQAKAFAEPLTAAMARFEINTPLRQAAFLAQCIHESAGFTRMEEALWYRTPERVRSVFRSTVPDLATAARLCGKPKALANRVYAGRNGNGPEASGDGWAYRGSGPIQLTGRANFRAAGQGCAAPFEVQPDLVRQPAGGCLSAAWFFASHGCNPLADSSQIDGITRIINGPAMLGASERRNLFRECLEALT